MKYFMLKISFPFVLVISVVLMVSGCLQKPNKAGHEKHWSYEGETGPAHWSELNSDNCGCSGKNQSPIDIDTNDVVKSNLPDIEFHNNPVKLKLVNNGHTVQANVDSGCSIIIDGDRYDLLQFHYHSLSEHTVNGKHYPVEIHFVYKDSSGALAVIGVFIKEGAENENYKPIWENLPSKPDEEYALSEPVDPGNLLPSDKRTYRYSGSLTTPPCTEGVKWFVMASPVEMSVAQIASAEKIYNHNYRPVLPLNARKVLYDTAVN